MPFGNCLQSFPVQSKPVESASFVVPSDDGIELLPATHVEEESDSDESLADDVASFVDCNRPFVTSRYRYDLGSDNLMTEIGSEE